MDAWSLRRSSLLSPTQNPAFRSAASSSAGTTSLLETSHLSSSSRLRTYKLPLVEEGPAYSTLSPRIKDAANGQFPVTINSLPIMNGSGKSAAVRRSQRISMPYVSAPEASFIFLLVNRISNLSPGFIMSSFPGTAPARLIGALIRRMRHPRLFYSNISAWSGAIETRISAFSLTMRAIFA